MSEWSNQDQMSSQLLNQKTVYVGTGAPGTAYDGQFWVDVSTNPPTVKCYDKTNTQWMEMHPIYYETQTGTWADPSTTPTTNGTLVVVYNSTQAGTRLYGRSNNAWVNMGGTLARVYPAGDQENEATNQSGSGVVDSTVWNTLNCPNNNTEYVLDTLNITPSEDHSTIAAFAGGVVNNGEVSSWKARLYIGGTKVDEEQLTTGDTSVFTSKGFVDDVSSTSTTVQVRIYLDPGSSTGNCYYAGSSLAAISVKT